MTRILLAAHPSVGHTSGLRAIGMQLLAEGHDVAMAVPRFPLHERLLRVLPHSLRTAASVAGKVEADGIQLLPLRVPFTQLFHGARIASATGQDEMAIALRFFSAGMKSQAWDIAGHVVRFRADIVVADYLMPAALLGARLAGRACAAFYHSALPFRAEGAPPFGCDLLDVSPEDPRWRAAQERNEAMGREFDGRVRKAAKALGLSFSPQPLMQKTVSAQLNILATLPCLEPGLGPLAGPVAMVGPCLRPEASVQSTHEALSRAQQAPGPNVYVSLGTVFSDKPHLYRAILEGLDLARVEFPGLQIWVSAGGSFRALKREWSGLKGTHFYEWLPQVPLLKEMHVVFTHGGNNTVQETLAAGRTMVVIPFGGDQWVNASRVVRLGVGAVLRPDALSAERVRTAFTVAMGHPMREQAKKLADKVRCGTSEAARKILDVLDR